MTLRHLQIFTTVADTGGMSKAARILHISQPSISQSVSELERHYGVKLFERLSQKLYLTKEGELMLSFSRHILDSFTQMETAMNQAAEQKELRIGCSVSVGTCLINPILDEAEKELPHCRFHVTVTNSSEIEQAVLNNKVDLAIVEGTIQNEAPILDEAEKELPHCRFHVTVTNSSEIEQAVLNNKVDLAIVEGTIQNEALTAEPICEDELVIVCGKNHPLAKESSVTLEMLQGQDYVSRESGSVERNQFEKLFEEQRLKLNRTFQSTNTEVIKNAVICGRGIAIFSVRMIQREVQEGTIVILPLKNITVTRNFNLIIHKNKFISKELQILKRICARTDQSFDGSLPAQNSH